MERLNEIMGRTMPRRPANPTQQPYPYQDQEQYPATQSTQPEPVSQPIGRRRLHDGYQHSNPTMYPSADRTNTMNDSDITYSKNYNQNAHIAPQYRQHQPDAQARQEPFFYRADVNHYETQPEADVLDEDEIEDDGELQMGYGDWEEDNHQLRASKQSNLLQYPQTNRRDKENQMLPPTHLSVDNSHSSQRASLDGRTSTHGRSSADGFALGSRSQTRRLTGIQETAPAYVEQPTQSGRSTHNGTTDNKRQNSPYGHQQPMEQSRVAQPVPRYADQQATPHTPVQPTSYISQGQPTHTAMRQGRQQQPPHPLTQEQEARYTPRTTQPLNTQALTNLNRQREYASQLNQARMRLTESVQPVSQTERKETQTVARLHPAPPARQVTQSQPMTFIPNKPVCTKCKGAGYLRASVPFGHPNFGKAIACECKEAERKEKRRQQLRDMSNLDAFRQKTFSTFNTHIPGIQEAYRAALDFETNPKGWLVFSGPNGCGKTHLAAAIANQALDNGAVVLFEAAPDLLDHLRAAFAPAATEVYDQLFSKMREAELLILDDLGAQQSSPWANEKLFQLLNYRYNLSMATVITGNPKGIQGVDERIRSRLSDTGLVRTIVMDRARDYRPHNPQRYS